MKTTLKSLLTLFIGVIAATVLMLLVNCLPTDGMQQSISESVVIMEAEGDYPELIPGYEASRLDNFTDSLMLVSSAYKADTGLIDRTMNVYRVLYEGKRPSEVLVAYGKGDTSYTTTSYARYWHGYQIILKPLLMVFNLQEIRYINMFVQLIVISSIILLMAKRNLKIYILSYLITILSFAPASVALSLQFSSVFYISNIALAVLLIWSDKLLKKKENIIIYFLCVGMATGFFDLLTYPVVTLGLPLIMIFVMKKKKSEIHNLLEFLQYSIVWVIGYGGMWASKWIVASLFLQKNMITDAIDAIFNRTSSEVTWAEFTRQDVIVRNFDAMFETPVKYLFVLYIVVSMIYLIYRMLRDKKNYIYNFQYLIIACIPIVWYAVLANHSYVHFWFTYREVIIFIFALLVWTTKNIDDCTTQLKHIDEKTEKKEQLA